ncbi:hypothetical protein MTO96_007294 [Rhipicephalus appendiculatus]
MCFVSSRAILFVGFTSFALWSLGARAERDAGIVFVVLSQDSAMSSKAGRAAVVEHSGTSSGAENGAAYRVPAAQAMAGRRWLERLHKTDGGWFFFCDDTTGVDLSLLHKALQGRNSTQEARFVGHALWDEETTIVHHFDDPRSLAYPDLSAGMALNELALKRVAEALDVASPDDFSIDRQYEVSVARGCATWTSVQAPSCADHVPKESLTVAVKTCSQFHKDRVPVIKATWAGDAHQVLFFSDVEDDRVPTITVGVANVERGHCAKTLAILRHVVSHGLLARWLLVADDDTLISIPRLLDLLSCFDPEDDVALGERYGFGAATERGYDYLTGGSGDGVQPQDRGADHQLAMLVFKGRLARRHDPGGVCLKQLGVSLTHSPLFHQGRPDDYNRQLLSHQRPISFHKFWMMDPVVAYRKWLQDSPHNATRHEEL